MQDQTSFIDFVNRVLRLRGENHVNKFSLKCGEYVEGDDVCCWISNVLKRGISDLAIHLSPELDYSLPSKLFVSKTLVRLRIEREGGIKIQLRNVHLPKLKTLYLDMVEFEADETEIEFAKLLSGCPVLEELVLRNLGWDVWDYCSVSSKTLKRLTLCENYDEFYNANSVSFDTPNVVYLEYSDTIANKYPQVYFDSLVEASIDLRMTDYQKLNAIYLSDGDDETNMSGNATDFLNGICNVKTLYLSDDTLEILTFCCVAIPLFNNLNHITIESNPEVGWESLPDLLMNSPNLETLVFQGLLHKETYRCGDVCLCQGLENSTSWLSSSPVKFLKILKFGETNDDDNEEKEMEMEQIKHFLEKMPNLEQLIIYYNTSIKDDLVEVSSQLQLLPEVASINCKVQIISDNLNLSFTYPTSLSMKFGMLL